MPGLLIHPTPPNRPGVDQTASDGMSVWASVRRPWRQVIATIALATIAAWTSRHWLPGPWNILVLSVPFLVSFGTNLKGARTLFGMVLAALFIGSLFANEVAAHLIFSTCLYD